MKLRGICLITNNVLKLRDFYTKVLGVAAGLMERIISKEDLPDQQKVIAFIGDVLSIFCATTPITWGCCVQN